MSTLEARIAAPKVTIESENLRILKTARTSIATPDKWWKGSMHNLDESRFCALGAVWNEVGRPCGNFITIAALGPLRDAAHTLYPDCSIAEINDYLGHAAVLKCYDLAIARLEANQ